MYEVRWRQLALDQLADAWVRAPELRADVTCAAQQIDDLLRRAPMDQGESRASGQERFVVVEPLAALFEVIQDDRKVTVLTIRLHRRP